MIRITPLLFGPRVLQWHEASLSGTSKVSDVGAVVAANQATGYVADASGSGKHLTQGAWTGGLDGLRPIYKEVGSEKFWRFTGSEAFRNTQPTGSGPRTVLIVGRLNTVPVASYQSLWAMADDVDHRSQIVFMGSGLTGSYPAVTAGNGFPASGPVAGTDAWALDTGLHAWAWQMQDTVGSRTSIRTYVDGVPVARAKKAGNFVLATEGAIGGNLNSNVVAQGFIGDLFLHVHLDGLLSSAEMVSFLHYAARKGVTIGARTRPNIVCDGDSLTVGEVVSAVSDEQSWPWQLQGYLDVPCDIQNLGISGRTTEQMLTQFAGRASALYSPQSPKNIAVLFPGSNDLGNGGPVSAATLYTRVAALVAAYKSAGFTVVLLTVLPRTYGPDPPDFESKRQQYRALVVPGLGGDKAGADYLLDIGADPILGDAATPLNSTYFNADHVHLTATSNTIIASRLASEILNNLL